MFAPKSWRYTVVLPHTNFLNHTIPNPVQENLLDGVFCLTVALKPGIIIIMNTLLQIFTNWGYITDSQLKELVEYFPHTKVVIQWGRMKRERLPAWEAIERMEKVEAEDIDYVRSVFFTSQDMDKLREVFHIVH